MKVSYCQRWSSKTSKPEFRKIDLQKRPTRILPFGFEWLKSQGTFPFVSSEGETNENKHDIQSRNREEVQPLHEALGDPPVKSSR